MPLYVVQHRYSSYRDGQRFGPWEAGEKVDLRDEDAAWINRDSEGCVAPHKPEPEPEPKTAARQQPAAKDRQHRGGSTRGAR